MAPRGEWEQVYGGPWGGLDYSRPYNTLEANSLAPGSVNTQAINGFQCASPWIAQSPWTTAFPAGEFVIGVSLFVPGGVSIIVTNQHVYEGTVAPLGGSGQVLAKQPLILLHTWGAGEIDENFLFVGRPCSFLTINGVLFIAGIMLNGIFQYNGLFTQTTNYVSAEYILDLDGRLVAAECRFPTGGGTGVGEQPTIAWSAVGVYTDFDPLLNQQAGFNLLGDVPDIITGMAGMGRSACIFRNNGISQMDPNGNFSTSGIQPFTFYHLWASNQGVGAFRGSVAQFGQQCLFRSSDNIYLMSLSGGLNAAGVKIQAKVDSDYDSAIEHISFASTVAGVGTIALPWYLSSIIEIAGQLHYLLSFNSPQLDTTINADFVNVMYDYNISEQSWNLWNLREYAQQSNVSSPGFAFFTTPIVQIQTANNAAVSLGSPVSAILGATFYLFGGMTSVGVINSGNFNPTGQVFQVVPFDYDFATNPFTPAITAVFTPQCLPQTTIFFRGEVISLGHKISTRRLRIQADNAPLPTTLAGSQQKAQVTFYGMGFNPQTGVQLTQPAPVLNMQGNAATKGAAIQTYYGDAVLSDEIIQAAISPVIHPGSFGSPISPWLYLWFPRLATVSLIGIDTTSTTQ